MMPIPPDEAKRLESLQHYQLLDTAAEIEYDRVSQIASQLCQTPIALVSLIDRDRQWVKSCYGLTVDSVPRNTSLCAYTITSASPLIIADTTKDDRSRDKPGVLNQPFIRFYAGVPLMSADGQAIGSLCVMDHTPRQLTPQQEIALQALADQAMLLMELRRANLTLERARKEAEETACQKAQLLATLSHEIRTPLQALDGYAKLLLEQVASDEQQPSLRRLQTTSQTLLQLVNNILDYSKLQAGKLVLEQIPFSVRDLISQAVEMLSGQAQQKALRINTWFDPSLPNQVRGDATRLFQVVVNLLGNALKFTREGQVTIDVRTIAQADSSITLQLEVTDTGTGIAAGSMATLFNEYTQVSAATSRLYGGSGLGLAITRQLLELMGSELAVRSQEGEGSCFGFCLTLPVVETAASVSPFQLHPKDVFLAVDDSPFNTMMLSHFFGELGGQLAIFHSPMAALEAAKHTGYRAMLLDLYMPELDGFELARLLQTHQPGVPLIALSADDSNETLDRVKERGFHFFLRKPFLPHELVHVLSEATK
ncbi:GAF domain-containing hybrid sensor histidine kinase/response regulator [Fibrivirga algicola]|uniref:histidine kinase n=1 Tax=Fibrivirga algicola TaxID=2950420 RepID=A0ABX0QPU8_9BACT|nr:GAF domain-containing hybrid sensor histidine kinase/response regulator [Fibrivirga algicola]NID12902.1 response regulator [Fibrivirga algicola]